MIRKRKKESKANNAVLPVMRPDAAGIDIGATEIFVAVAADRATENVRSFPTFTQDLYALADWLKQCGVKPWQWNRPAFIGSHCSRFWKAAGLRSVW